MPKRGLYVAFDGPDGAGKSSVLAAVKAEIDAAAPRANPLYVREPGSTPTGEKIRRILLDEGGDMLPLTEAYLFAAARAELLHGTVLPHLKAGGLVVSDRCVYSSLAYQGGGRGLGVDAVRELNLPATAGTEPDLTVLLTVDGETAAKRRRRAADRLEAAGDAFVSRVEAAYRGLAASLPGKIVAVDAAAPLASVVAQAVRAVMRAVRERYAR